MSIHSTFFAQLDPLDESSGGTVWEQRLDMANIYRFGIGVDTAVEGSVQLYFEGKKARLLDRGRGKYGDKLAGEFFPGGGIGAADPQMGLYGHKNAVVDEVWIYEVIVGTELVDIKGVAGIE